MNRVRNAIVSVATTALTTLLVTASAVLEPEHARRAALLDRLPDLLDDLVVALEEAEPAPAFGQIVDVVGHRRGEVVHLADERRHEEGADGDHRQHGADEDDADRRAATPQPSRLQPVDRRIQSHREKRAIATQISTSRVTQMTRRAMKATRATPRTTRTARGRKMT